MPYQLVKTFNGEQNKLGTFLPGENGLFVYKKDKKWFLVHTKSRQSIGFYQTQEIAYNVGRMIKYNIPQFISMQTKEELMEFINFKVPYELKNYIQRPEGYPYLIIDDTPTEVYEQRIKNLIEALRSGNYQLTITCLHFVNRDTNQHYFNWEGVACDLYQKDKNDLKIELNEKIYYYDDHSSHMPFKVLKYFNFRDNNFQYKTKDQTKNISDFLNFNQVADILEQKPYGLFREKSNECR